MRMGFMAGAFPLQGRHESFRGQAEQADE